MNIHFFNSKERKDSLEKLNEQFGISKLPEKILQTGKEKFRLFTGDFSEREIQELNKVTFIEGIGLYIAKEERDNIRLSIEGTQIFEDQINKNIFELNEEQFKMWVSGQDIQIKTGKKGYYVMKYKGDFLGCGKISENKISNFISKGRRIKATI